MKKLMLPLSLLALASLGACSLSQNSSTPQGAIGTVTKGVTANLSSSEMAYAFAGASSINFLDDALGEEGGEGETVDTPVEGDSSSYQAGTYKSDDKGIYVDINGQSIFFYVTDSGICNELLTK